MQIINIGLTLLVLSLFSGTASSGSQGRNGEGQPLDSRIEKFVQKTCGNDTACIEKKRAEYSERMTKYKQHVHKKCGDDKACRDDMRAKYMQRRAKREERVAQHCGDDEACRDELREKYSLKMKEAREKCSDEKACWKAFYKENKPKDD